MSAEQNKSWLDKAREAREETITITHSCGHVSQHQIVSRYGIKAFVAREESRLCIDCVRAEKATVNWAKVEAAKAIHRNTINTAATNLAALEIVQSQGGELVALELAVLLIKHFQTYNRSAWELCKQAGFDPEEIITLERLIG